MSGAHVDRSPLEVEVGARCRAVREGRGLGLGPIAELLGLDKGALSRMERGDRPISRDVVRHLARIYGVSVAHLEFGVPNLVYVLVRAVETDVEVISGFSDVTEADEWARIADEGDELGYRVAAIAVDDTETMRLFAEERLASRINTKEVMA